MEKRHKMNTIAGILTAALICSMSPTVAVADEDDDFNEADYIGVITIIEDEPVPIAEAAETGVTDGAEQADGTDAVVADAGQTEQTEQTDAGATDGVTGDGAEMVPDPAAGPGVTQQFVDLEANAWYLNAVDYVVSNNIISGIDDKFFGPEIVTTRGMLATALYRHAGSPSYIQNAEYADVVPYTDIDQSQYYCGAVSWGTINGILTGYENGTFRPNNSITREELAVILYRYAKFMKLDTGAGNGTDAGCFIDASDISDYAVEAVSWACRNGILSGYEDGAIRPHYSATRAQVAMMLMRLDEVK